MPSDERVAGRRLYADAFNTSPMMRHLGARISFTDTDRVRIDLDITEHHRGGRGTDAVNGGVIAAAFDIALGCTAALVDPAHRSATMQVSMSFERPLEGDRLVTEGWVDRAGSRVLFASAETRDATGAVCARAQGVIRMTDLPWGDRGPGGT